MRCQYGLDHGLYRCAIPGVHRERRGTDGTGDFFEPGSIPTREHDPTALGGEPSGNGGSNSTRAADNDGHGQCCIFHRHLKLRGRIILRPAIFPASAADNKSR